jgi:translation initiation factor 2B subunit (eIF-2B alpha/beta/delta family)
VARHNEPVTDLSPELQQRIARIAADRESGASDILAEAIDILRTGLAASLPVAPLGRALCRAQPSMAPVWNAVSEAIAAEREPGRFERFAQRVARSPAALTRFATAALTADAAPPPLRLVTLSSSRAVAGVIEAVHATRPVHVSCSESRPALEGRRLAATLAARGIAVTCFGDAALGHALSGAHAVLVGADAVGPRWFLNKSGTAMLAAAATQHGVPVYVLATRDKFVSAGVAARLVIREGAAAEIWTAPPHGVEVRNPYFEPTPLDLVRAVICDAGVLGADMVRDVCATAPDAGWAE